MSSNTTGTVNKSRADKRRVVCSMRPASRLRKLIVTHPRHKKPPGHSIISLVTATWKNLVKGSQTDRSPDLSSVRPHESVRKELPIQNGSKSEEDVEPVKRVNLDVQTPENQDKSSTVEFPNGNTGQVEGGSETYTTGTKYYLEHLTVPPNSPDRESTEINPKDKARIDVADERNFKRPELPEDHEKSSLFLLPYRKCNGNRGSWTTSTGQKYYFLNLPVPPNSPELGSAETALQGKTRIDMMDERNWKPPIECPYVTQERRKTRRTAKDSSATKKSTNHRVMHQKSQETNKTNSILDMDKYSTKCNASSSDNSSSETEESFYVAERAAALKAWKAKKHAVAERKKAERRRPARSTYEG
ncbi:uncharacterized protein N7500_002516 [Penicillium coprophilum]|uniref:uncharacterized protein n=1 Tax=Penicillium coprophilum TaxID=36646 RepID=UPI002384E395|nr:uncharacterized protein N7500_002516 [Penicillium coprophilum]KAJ5169733.1 hypothetical protein N7500_002516 [Penicillium coprophilum]